MPVRNDAQHLDAAVRAVLDQSYPGDLEIIIAVGPSDDTSAKVADALAEADARIQVVRNPSGRTPAALNRAIEVATGEIVARVDARAELSPGYLRTAVEVLQETGAENVGGIQQAVGTTPMQRAVAAAMSSRFGVGDARFHYGGEAGPTDTVYLGVFPRTTLLRVGGFDESLVRNQDYELNWRIRRNGGTVWFDPRLVVAYQPRSTLKGLASQYWQYGRWKRVVIRRHPQSLRWRQLAPPLAVLGNAGAIVLAPFVPAALAIPGVYLSALIFASVIAGKGDPQTLARLPLVFVTMHHAWGAGFLSGPPQTESSPEGE